MDNIHSITQSDRSASACEVPNASPSTVATTLDYERTRRARDVGRRDDVGEERSGNGGTAIRSLLSSPPQHTRHGSWPAAQRFTSGIGVGEGGREGGESQGDRGNDETRPRHTREREREQEQASGHDGEAEAAAADRGRQFEGSKCTHAATNAVNAT